MRFIEFLRGKESMARKVIVFGASDIPAVFRQPWAATLCSTPLWNLGK